MRRAAGSSTAQLGDWQWQPLSYHTVLPGRLLARVTGSALVDDHEVVPWSSVVKVFRQSAVDVRGEIESSTREILAYRSGLLVDLPGRLRAPRVLEIDEDDRAVWLWLEDVKDIYARCWPLEQFGLAARHLGQFNGAYLVSRAVPTDAWLNHWLSRRQAELQTGLKRNPAYVELQQLVRHSRVQRMFRASIATRATQLLQDQAQLIDALSHLPLTLCHHESSLANLFAVRRPDGQLETVAVDWERIGPASIGADISTLVFGTMRRCEFDAEHAVELDQMVFDGYVAGLGDAGWYGDVQQVRLGYTAAIALRWSFLASALRELLDGAPQVQQPSQGWRVTRDAAARQWVRLIEFTLDRADEAHRLVASMSSG